MRNLFFGVIIGIGLTHFCLKFDNYSLFLRGETFWNAATCEDPGKADWHVSFDREYGPFWYSICEGGESIYDDTYLEVKGNNI